MPQNRPNLQRNAAVLWIGLCMLPACQRAPDSEPSTTTTEVASSAPALAQPVVDKSVIEYETRSEFSHIRVRRNGQIRSLIFVRDTGDEMIESVVNLERPDQLLAPYTRIMFASHLFVQPKRVLIVGLGGGGMIHFLKHHQPELEIDAVEIDPAVVKVAGDFFQIKSEGKITIHTADGLKYLTETERAYDVIYMDAFLKPTADTDSTGAPLKLKTIEFYKSVQKKLAPGGVVVFNLNTHNQVHQDLAAIEHAFERTYTFRVPKAMNLVVVAASHDMAVSTDEMRRRGADLDKRFKADFSFEEMTR